MSKDRLKIIPLGGLGEIGKNMMVIEHEDDIIIIDAGLMFPEEDMHGIDLVIPDMSYLLEHKHKLRGIIFTHGHEDHIGAIPYLLREIDLPVYATKLTAGLISMKLREHGLLKNTKLVNIQSGKKFGLGKFQIEPFAVCHSIPDAVGLIIYTSKGIIVHSGDFKMDYTPVNGKASDLSRLAQLGTNGVLLLMSDSTYADLPGYTPSEMVVGKTLERIISEAPGRVIITTFASLISRIQLVLDAALKYSRRVFVIGRSMKETVRLATELGYLRVPNGVFCRPDEINRFPHNEVILLTTGSQGEPTSALVRITNRDNNQIRITPGDTVIMSATPVPGNEALVNRIIDNLFKQGAHVIYERLSQVHVHGHGSQEELKLLISLVRPRFFVPIHGEYRHLHIHGELAASLGMPRPNIFIMQDGDILELDANKGRITGRAPSNNVYVDGLVMEDMAGAILRDRKLLSKDGIVVVIIAMDKNNGIILGRPDIISRGFIVSRENDAILDQGRELVISSLSHAGKHPLDKSSISTKVKDTLGKFFYEQTKRRPMIITTTIEI
ncbi:MAG TPA: ribonuclease J [Dehalococcoidia bacterium]|nr:ribonuclease J [Dehalococcoidia bacterium]